MKKLKELKAIFNSMDVDKTGFLTFEQTNSGFYKNVLLLGEPEFNS